MKSNWNAQGNEEESTFAEDLDNTKVDKQNTHVESD